jgi:hypothetical protein
LTSNLHSFHVQISGKKCYVHSQSRQQSFLSKLHQTDNLTCIITDEKKFYTLCEEFNIQKNYEHDCHFTCLLLTRHPERVNSSKLIQWGHVLLDTVRPDASLSVWFLPKNDFLSDTSHVSLWRVFCYSRQLGQAPKCLFLPAFMWKMCFIFDECPCFKVRLCGNHVFLYFMYMYIQTPCILTMFVLWQGGKRLRFVFGPPEGRPTKKTTARSSGISQGGVLSPFHLASTQQSWGSHSPMRKQARQHGILW